MKPNLTSFASSVAIVAIALCSVAVAQAPAAVDTGISLSNMDTSVRPGNNFYLYANGGFIARTKLPADRAGIGVSGIQASGETRKAFEDHLVIIQSALILAALLVVFVGGLGLTTTLTLSVLERTREIGIMSAMTRVDRSRRMWTNSFWKIATNEFQSAPVIPPRAPPRPAR